MWTVTNKTPFAADRGWVRGRDGAETWLVAVKGTFAIQEDGRLEVADEQADVCLAPEYRGDPAESSLLYDTDFQRLKTGTDVLLNGQAYAPGDEPATEVDVTLEIADRKKTLHVVGDRTWEHSSFLGLRLSAPEPFESMPITYERAFGGADLEASDSNDHSWLRANPVGVGFAIRDEHLDGKPAPNIEDPRTPTADGRRRAQPVGFGAIAGHWEPRVEFVGTYDDRWQEERMPLLPEDFDDRFYQCAPTDQQFPGFLKGGESVKLTNLTPGGELQFSLPHVRLGFTTIFQPGYPDQHHRGHLHTVIIEPDEARLILVWHSFLPCHNRETKILTTRVNLLDRLHRDKEPWELTDPTTDEVAVS